MIKTFLKLFTRRSDSIFELTEEEKQKAEQERNLNKAIYSSMSRPIYKELTKEIIDNLKDSDLAETIYVNIHQLMGNDSRDTIEILPTYSKGQQAIFSIDEIETEVLNGGFYQCYVNSSKDFTDMAVEGFKLIGATRFADLMIEANKVYLDNKDKIEKDSEESSDEFEGTFDTNLLNDLDERFYQLYKEENLDELKVKYIRNHIDEFIQK